MISKGNSKSGNAYGNHEKGLSGVLAAQESQEADAKSKVLALGSRAWIPRGECRFAERLVRNGIMKKGQPYDGKVPYRTLPATFAGVNALVHNVSFYKCDIQSGVFDNAYLFFTEFDECDLRYASFSGSGTSLITASFHGSDMNGARLRHANAEGADFSNLKSASGTDFLGANLAGARFFGTDLRGAKNLTFARNLDLADFKGATLTGIQETAIKSAAARRMGQAMRKDRQREGELDVSLCLPAQHRRC